MKKYIIAIVLFISCGIAPKSNIQKIETKKRPTLEQQLLKKRTQLARLNSEIQLGIAELKSN